MNLSKWKILLNNEQWTSYFSETFIKQILPLEVNNTILLGKKDYRFYSYVFKIFVDGFKKEQNNQSLVDIKKDLNKEIKKLEFNYLKTLIKSFENQIIGLDWKEINNLKDTKQYIKAISKIEEFIEIDKIKNQAFESRKSIHLKLLMKVDFNSIKEDIKPVFESYIKVSNLIFNAYDDEEEKVTSDLYYIVQIISAEAWNFLSHYTHAYYFYKTDDYFSKNIHRAKGHLERATLDAYKYLIIRNNVKDQKLLHIRMHEIYNFSNAYNLEKVFKGYRDCLKEANPKLNI